MASTVMRAELKACAPDFELTSLEGKTTRLSKNEGKPTFINFWNTWCGPCNLEMPDLQKAYDRWKSDVRFLMVNETTLEEDAETVALFLEKNRYTFPVLLDQGEKSVGFNQYGLRGVPASFLVDSQGKLVWQKLGALQETELNQVLEQYVKR